jgi:hypothetical protein
MPGFLIGNTPKPFEVGDFLYSDGSSMVVIAIQDGQPVLASPNQVFTETPTQELNKPKIRKLDLK